MPELARRLSCAPSPRLRQQLWQPDEVVGCSCKREGPSDFFEPSILGFSEPGYGLDPAEALFDAFANALARNVAGMPGGTSIDGRATGRVSCDVRRYVDLAQFH